MADALHEFYNASNLGFTTLSAGQNIGATTGSQKAVIRDICITNTGNKNLEIKLGNHVIATASKTETLSGTLILKESQNLTLYATDSITWTGIRMMYESASTYKELTWDAEYFFLIPSASKNTVSTGGWKTNKKFRENGSNLQNASDLDGNIFAWDAHSMFGQTKGDFYYTRDYSRAKSNNEARSNKIYFYDASADSSTQVNAGSTSNDRRMWEGGWTNRYLIRLGQYSGSAYDRYDAFDTTTNSLAKDNAEMIRGYDSNTSNEDRIEDIYYYNRMTSIMDQYVFIKGLAQPSTSRAAHLLDITTGRYRTWYGGDANDTYNTKFNSNSSSYGSYYNSAQICKGEDGIYRVIWSYTRGSSTHQSGFQIWNLSSDPAATYLAHGTGSFTYAAGFQYYYADTSNWDKFRTTESNVASRQGYMSGFVPLKRITPTSSGCRYWMFLGSQVNYVIDIQATGSDGVTPVRYDQGSYNNYIYPWQGQSDLNDYVANAWPVYDETAAASGWGDVAVRTSGILNT